MTEMMEIDGSILEGGGQILRISISLSAIFGVPVRVTNIRAGRSKPGLQPQHLTGIQLVAEMCSAKLKGGHIGSTEIEFSPGKIKGGHYFADTKTAGSVCLLLQVALPCALVADSPVTFDLKGGTNASMAPQIDFMNDIFRPTLKKFGADFKLNILRRGYFPKGGGQVTVEVTPVKKLLPITMTDRGVIQHVTGKSFVAGVLPVKMAHQMAEGAKGQLKKQTEIITIDCFKEDSWVGNFSGIILSCATSTGCVMGSDGMGSRGVDAMEVGRRAGEEMKECLERGACVDNYVMDQIVIYMALASGTSSVAVGDVTLHAESAIYVTERIAKTKFSIHSQGAMNVMKCTGLSFENKNILEERL